MQTVKKCIKNWEQECIEHYSMYSNSELAKVVCNIPYDLFDNMNQGFWERQCTSGGSCYGTDYYDNIPFNVIGLRQMADKATDVSLLPSVCNNTKCMVSEAYLKLNLSGCNHGAYANSSNELRVFYLVAIIIAITLVMMF